MSAGTMTLHKGARHVSLDDVAAVACPSPTRSWFPIAHVAVLEAVQETLAGTGFAIQKTHLALSSNEMQFFATLDLYSDVGEGVNLAVGIRNSIDRTLPLGFAAGHRVFVCDNLSFSAEMMVNRKHTSNGAARFKEAIAHATSKLENFRKAEAGRIALMHTLLLDDAQAESVILRAWEAKVISHLQVPGVVKEWREPSHAEFEPRTRWSLFNAFTEVLKPFSESNPQAFAGRTYRLNSLMVPPNEGPVDLDHTDVEVEGYASGKPIDYDDADLIESEMN